MSTSVPKACYPLNEFPELMSDACLCDNGQLVCLSLWGRDTSIQEFLGRATLGSSQHGITRFHLVSALSGALPVYIGNVDQLDKHATRTFHRSLFGSVLNVWLYDCRCTTPDKVNGQAYAVMSSAHDSLQIRARLWALVRETCPLPLLDHWEQTVLDVLQSSEMLAPLPFCVGPIIGYRLKFDQPQLTESLGTLIRNRTLTAYPRTQSTMFPAAA